MTTTRWDDVKRQAEQARVAAGHPVRTDADREAGQRRLDDEIHAHPPAGRGPRQPCPDPERDRRNHGRIRSPHLGRGTSIRRVVA
ncbi:hypothetical protein [Protofrankia symbiont of Coriaria ruscifolia]|uniref:hypothetical protein n=1 Tax=Protofrankia symbiont of Coriaria ruscifolia TaxID=1306542 RepID=UPI0013EFC041|nr:hypothetical protein [Protofrankia symbiont of Coriaria ruscifolia]